MAESIKAKRGKGSVVVVESSGFKTIKNSSTTENSAGNKVEKKVAEKKVVSKVGDIKVELNSELKSDAKVVNENVDSTLPTKVENKPDSYTTIKAKPEDKAASTLKTEKIAGSGAAASAANTTTTTAKPNDTAKTARPARKPEASKTGSIDGHTKTVSKDGSVDEFSSSDEKNDDDEYYQRVNSVNRRSSTTNAFEMSDSLACRWVGCGIEYPTSGLAREHEMLHGFHGLFNYFRPIEESNFICGFSNCGKPFLELRQLRKHLLLHRPRQHACKHCRKMFHDAAKLKRHELVHSGIRQFTCEVCQRGFGFKANLKTHERTHSGERPFSCPVPNCGKMFSQASNRNSHLMTHTDKDIKHIIDATGEKYVPALSTRGFGLQKRGSSALIGGTDELDAAAISTTIKLASLVPTLLASGVAAASKPSPTSTKQPRKKSKLDDDVEFRQATTYMGVSAAAVAAAAPPPVTEPLKKRAKRATAALMANEMQANRLSPFKAVIPIKPTPSKTVVSSSVAEATMASIPAAAAAAAPPPITEPLKKRAKRATAALLASQMQANRPSPFKAVISTKPAPAKPIVSLSSAEATMAPVPAAAAKFLPGTSLFAISNKDLRLPSLRVNLAKLPKAAAAVKSPKTLLNKAKGIAKTPAPSLKTATSGKKNATGNSILAAPSPILRSHDASATTSMLDGILDTSAAYCTTGNRFTPLSMFGNPQMMGGILSSGPVQFTSNMAPVWAKFAPMVYPGCVVGVGASNVLTQLPLIAGISQLAQTSSSQLHMVTPGGGQYNGILFPSLKSNDGLVQPSFISDASFGSPVGSAFVSPDVTPSVSKHSGCATGVMSGNGAEGSVTTNSLSRSSASLNESSASSGSKLSNVSLNSLASRPLLLNGGGGDQQCPPNMMDSLSKLNVSAVVDVPSLVRGSPESHLV